jgi:retron-type reverse transcriptase
MRYPIFSAAELHEAYLDCRRRKRGTANALRFEMNQAGHLLDLEAELNSGSFRPSRSVCFINLRPKPREIFAADFRDRVVHHLFVREIERHWERVFIHDSYACRPGKGTHAAVDRLERFVRSTTRGGRRRAWFLQLDVHNFFMSIDRRILLELIDDGLRRQYGVPRGKLPLFCPGIQRYQAMRELARTLIFHDPTDNFVRKSPTAAWKHIPDHKTLFNCPEFKGLPIGNLTSQFYGNVYLNALDQFVKHELKARHYVRYVDDAILLHEDRQVLADWKEAIERFLAGRLLLRLNEGATRLKPVSCGINFLGYIIHPDHRLTRRRVAGSFQRCLEETRELLVSRDAKTGVFTFRFDHAVLERLLATLNSFLAHLAKANSHRLLATLLDEHPWLGAYFHIDGLKAIRYWTARKSFRRVAEQWRWYRTRWPDAAIFFQVGHYFELYGRDADWAAKVLGLRPQEPRFRSVHRVGIPVRLLDGCAARTLATGRPVLKVAETGYPHYHLKERLPTGLLLPASGGLAAA